MMSSNDISESDMIVRELYEMVQNKKMTIKQIAETLLDICKQHYYNALESDILDKYHLSYETFLKNSKELSNELVRTIEDEIRSYNYQFQSDFIVLGIDDAPHLYIVTKERKLRIEDFIGFAIIGSGYPLALSEMTRFPYDVHCKYNEALLRVFLAKKESERVSTVGETTHLFCLKINKNRFITHNPSEGEKRLINKAAKELSEKRTDTYNKYFDALNKLNKKTKISRS